MGNFVDLTGRRFGKWVANWPSGKVRHDTMWLCLCDCGNISTVSGDSLRGGGTKKCRGCVTTHGLSYTPEYKMWGAAKWRAKQEGIPFNITPQDIIIPDVCPLLKIPLVHQKNRMAGNSPSLDKIVPSLGYVKGNIQVISQKANIMKNSATFEEAALLVKNWAAQLWPE